MSSTNLAELVQGVKAGQIAPYLGPYALNGSVNAESGEPIPARNNFV